MSALFQFGERMPDYSVPVLNEREVRAGAGLLFVIAFVAFSKAWFTGDFGLIRIVVIGFFVEFVIRVLINPRFAPSLIVGRWLVSAQTPEYTGAPQKLFAWSLGLAMAALMIVLVGIFDVRGPINLLICALCLVFLFFEAAFGICIGCKIYAMFVRTPPQLCPGDVCEIKVKHEIQKIVPAQGFVLVGFTALMIAVVVNLGSTSKLSASPAAESGRCVVPGFAKAIGHEEMWKLHNNCK
jgi:hypothetical protein